MDMCDEDLLTLIAGNRDEEAFKTLMERYMGLVHAVAYRMGMNATDAEDIVQEVFLRVWNKAGSWNKDRGASVSTWLYRISYNLCIDRKRKMKHSVMEIADEPVDGNLSAEGILQEKQTAQLVRQAIGQLPLRQRAALVLCHYQGLSNMEAASILDTSVKSIEGLLVRARKTLQQKLRKQKGVLRS